MQPSIYAGVFLALLIAALATKERLKWIWWLFILCQLFAATSIAGLSALGGASLAMPQGGVAILIPAAYITVAMADGEVTRRSFATHAAILALIGYCLIISFFGPRLFADSVQLIAMRPDIVGDVAVPSPLGPRSSNITHSFYMTGSLLTALATSMIFARKLPASDFRNALLAAGVLHATLGLIDWLGMTAGLGRVLDFLKNANYTMVDQSIDGVNRLSGALTEPSAYAGAAIPFGVFATEEWVRTRKKSAGLAGLFIWVMTIASTSSGGIVTAVLYAAVWFPRFLFMPGRIGAKTMVIFVVGGLILAGIGVALTNKQVFEGVSDFFLDLTVRKGETKSAEERGTWAMQGLIAFQTSYGLGTGAGSFRSSSMVTAIIGSFGVVGCVLFLVYVGQLVWATMVSGPTTTQRSAAWAALFALVSPALSGASPDPGFVFGCLAGFALHPRFARAPSTTYADTLPHRISAAQARQA